MALAAHRYVEAVIVVAIVLAVAYVGFRYLSYLRPKTSKDDTSPTDLLSDLEELRSGGDISEEELRSIKAVLGRNQRNQQSDS